MSWKRIITVTLAALFVIGIFGAGFKLGLNHGQNFPKNIIVRGVAGIDPTEPVTANFGLFWEAWEKINERFLRNDQVSDQEKVYGAISGLLSSIGDDYAEFFNPEDRKKFDEDIRGNFGGIGAEIGIRDETLTVIAPLKNTPASKAGLKAGDKILEIDGESTDGLSIEESVKIIRGNIGTSVTLTVFREGWEETKEIAVTRANIVIPTLDYQIRDDKIAVIELYSFNSNSNKLFYEAMLDILSKNSQGLVLDLRNNPGGFLEVAVDLASYFLPEETLVVSETSREDSLEFRSRGGGALEDFPTVILINKGSASAAEILAGALRDQKKIPLIGETTFGKGTVQQLEELFDGSSLKLTVANWVLPSGKIIDQEGLEPDFVIPLTEEDIKAEKDPQLEKAIEVLKSLGSD